MRVKKQLWVVVILAVLTAGTGRAALGMTQAAVSANATALQEFQQRLDAYLQMRQDLADKLQPLAPTSSAAELAGRQAALAKALQTARAAAKRGDLIPEAVAKQIAATVADDFKRRTALEEKATFAETPDAGQPVINQTYPADAALPTVPPLLLANLPRLPDNLQYRFYGRHLLILDGDVQTIVDYIPNALPPH